MQQLNLKEHSYFLGPYISHVTNFRGDIWTTWLFLWKTSYLPEKRHQYYIKKNSCPFEESFQDTKIFASIIHPLSTIHPWLFKKWVPCFISLQIIPSRVNDILEQTRSWVGRLTLHMSTIWVNKQRRRPPMSPFTTLNPVSITLLSQTWLTSILKASSRTGCPAESWITPCSVFI